jgi:hypothetical protein
MTTKNGSAAVKDDKFTPSGFEGKPPAGYVEQSGDIVGFWTGEGAVHFIPRFVRMFDSNLDPAKTSTLLVGELVDPCPEVTPPESEEKVLAGKGDKIGIWTKPGMRALSDLGGVPVYMYLDGEKDIGKPSPMKMYKIMSRSRGQKLPVEADFRVKSKPAPKAPEAASVTEEIPFS